MPLDGPCCVSGRPRSRPGFVWGVGAPVNAWTAPRPVYGASSHVEEIREPIRAARMYARPCCCGYLGVLWCPCAKYGDSRRCTHSNGIFIALCLPKLGRQNKTSMGGDYDTHRGHWSRCIFLLIFSIMLDNMAHWYYNRKHQWEGGENDGKSQGWYHA